MLDAPYFEGCGAVRVKATAPFETDRLYVRMDADEQATRDQLIVEAQSLGERYLFDAPQQSEQEMADSLGDSMRGLGYPVIQSRSKGIRDGELTVEMAMLRIPE